MSKMKFIWVGTPTD